MIWRSAVLLLAFANALQPLLPRNLNLLPAEHEVRIRRDARLNEVLVVPSLKFIFCFVPKNAGTQFNRLMNALNGIERTGGVCSGADEPNYASTMHGNFTADLFEKALNDPTWTKATFLRDPLERMVSAYLSKCVAPRECGGCFGLENLGQDRPDFNELADRLPYGDNAHFLPQSSLCGGLSDTIENYDYVGHVSDDTNAVNAQVASMLELVLRRNSDRAPALTLLQGDAAGAAGAEQIARELVQNYFVDGSDAAGQVYAAGQAHDSSAAALSAAGGANASISGPIWNASFSASMLQPSQTATPLQPFGEGISAKGAEMLRLGGRLFPEEGPSGTDPHVHKGQPVTHSVWREPWRALWRRRKAPSRPRNSTEQASELFGNSLTLIKALDRYAEDYDRLPGLHRPPWASRVASYYDIATWLTRPGWLAEEAASARPGRI